MYSSRTTQRSCRPASRRWPTRYCALIVPTRTSGSPNRHRRNRVRHRSPQWWVRRSRPREPPGHVIVVCELADFSRSRKPKRLAQGYCWGVSLPPFARETGYLPSESTSRHGSRSSTASVGRHGGADVLDGLSEAARLLAVAGCRKIRLNGSFVTAKDTPGDFDAVWDDSGVDESGLDPVFFDLARGRKAQKMRFGGEVVPELGEPVQ
jgi:hypothetical protein